jgi:hypothetical protein
VVVAGVVFCRRCRWRVTSRNGSVACERTMDGLTPCRKSWWATLQPSRHLETRPVGGFGLHQALVVSQKAPSLRSGKDCATAETARRLPLSSPPAALGCDAGECLDLCARVHRICGEFAGLQCGTCESGACTAAGDRCLSTEYESSWRDMELLMALDDTAWVAVWDGYPGYPATRSGWTWTRVAARR